MAKWNYQLSVKDIFAPYKQSKDADIPVKDVAAKIAEKMQALYKHMENQEPDAFSMLSDLDGFITELSDFPGDLSDFNQLWNNVYDWADDNRVWIATF